MPAIVKPIRIAKVAGNKTRNFNKPDKVAPTYPYILLTTIERPRGITIS